MAFRPPTHHFQPSKQTIAAILKLVKNRAFQHLQWHAVLETFCHPTPTQGNAFTGGTDDPACVVVDQLWAYSPFAQKAV